MPTPLPDSVSATLRSDPTAALGALMVIARAHAELFRWAARQVCEAESRTEASEVSTSAQPARSRPQPSPKRKANGVHKPTNGADAHLARRREARDRDDEGLLEAMRDSPEASIPDWAEAIGKSRSSTVTALHRLRDAGLVESIEGKWRLTEPPAPREPAPKWIVPLSTATHAHASP